MSECVCVQTRREQSRRTPAESPKKYFFSTFRELHTPVAVAIAHRTDRWRSPTAVRRASLIGRRSLDTYCYDTSSLFFCIYYYFFFFYIAHDTRPTSDFDFVAIPRRACTSSTLLRDIYARRVDVSDYGDDDVRDHGRRQQGARGRTCTSLSESKMRRKKITFFFFFINLQFE